MCSTELKLVHKLQKASGSLGGQSNPSARPYPLKLEVGPEYAFLSSL